MRENRDPQTYSIGIKELWKGQDIEGGVVDHSVGWPTPHNTYAGGFLYSKENEVHVGYIVGLNYKNPYINPYQEF